MTFDEANEYLAKRIFSPTALNSAQISGTVERRYRAQAFFSAQVENGRVLDHLRQVSDAYSRGEMDLATAREKTKRWLDSKGFQREEKMDNVGGTARLDLIYRQNAAMGAAVGRYKVSRSPDVEERWPCWRYIAGHNPRPSHAALDGKVFLKSDPVWHRIYPPWDFNCNCDVEDAELPPGGPDRIRTEDVQAPESGYEFDPADAFAEFDPAAIKDAFTRSAAVERLKAEFGCTETPDGKLRMPPDNSPEEPDNSPVAKNDLEAKQLTDNGIYPYREQGMYNKTDLRKMVGNAIQANARADRSPVTREGRSQDQVGKNVLAEFNHGPVRDVIAETLQPFQDECRRLGIQGIRGIAREKEKTANSGDGILAFNEVELARLYDKNAQPLEKRLGGSSEAFSREDKIKCIAYHEMAHHVLDRYVMDDGTPLMDAMRQAFGNRNGREACTEYADKNFKDWFAENMALHRMGRNDLVDKDPTLLRAIGEIDKKTRRI